MATQLFRNNASSALAVSIAPGDLTVQVSSGQGALYPSPGAGEYFLVTIEDIAGNIEVCKCTSRSTDLLTVVRAQESTSAQSFTAGDARVELRSTRGTLERFVQYDSGVISLSIQFTGTIQLPLTTTLNGGAIWGAANDGAGSGLDADLLDGVQGADYARISAANTFTALQTISGASPALNFVETDGAANGKAWRVIVDAGSMFFSTLTDALGFGADWMIVSRTATTVDSIALAATAVTVNGVSINSAAGLTTGTLDDGRVAESNVTQHQAALAINTDQLVTDGTAEAGTSRTLGAGDAESIIRTSSSSTVTITLPQVPTGWSANDSAAVIRKGTGAVNFAAGSGATIESRNSLLGISARYGCVVATFDGAGVWSLTGDLG